MFVNRQITYISDAIRFAEEEFEMLNSILDHINQEFQARSKAAKRAQAIEGYYKLMGRKTQKEDYYAKQSSESSYKGLADVTQLDPRIFNKSCANYDPNLENHPFKNELMYFAILIAETRGFLNEMSVQYQMCIT